ncbi:hypothetical protein Ancab_018164 [Ancistrocladus abbreviatus]
MAQVNTDDQKAQDTQETEIKQQNPSSTVTFKFNAHAPEFVPRSHAHAHPAGAQMPISGAYFYPYFQFLDASVVGSDWLYVTDPDSYRLFPNPNLSLPNSSKSALVDDLQQKIMKQVEYLFSDLSLLANDTMAKHVSKDPEGYVPIAAIASMKKIKALVNNNYNLLIQALRSSAKLVVSNDCKKVKRRNPFTENYKDDLQCRTVVAENLPDDHSYQNLENIFSAMGSVKAIRLCHPQEANASRSKSDLIISNKLHALVEYENAEIAEKAAENLNDERNWRKGLRVRLLLRCSPKSVLKSRKPDFDVFNEEDEVPPDQSLEDSLQSNGPVPDYVADNNYVVQQQGEENSGGGLKKVVLARGRGKAKGRGGQVHNGRGLLAPPPPTITLTQSSSLQCDVFVGGKPTNNNKGVGPRMPDGTRGFTMGRGKPLSCPAPPAQVPIPTSSSVE